jgi:hypothetical protein
MARITPVAETELVPSMKVAFERHVQGYQSRITNMKATLGHSLLAFEIYMQWYPLYQQVEKILGKRLAYLYAYSISKASSCPLYSAYFRKIITDAGEQPENIVLTPSQKNVLDFGSSVTRYHGHIADRVYNAVAEQYTPAEMIVLIAFAGQMIATNIFNNVIETEIDEYLVEYLPSLKYQ